MPNWCMNTMLIKGDPDAVGELLSFIEEDGNPISFNKIIAMPPQLKGESAPERDETKAEDNLAKYGAKDWYDWSNKFWGTKWNSSDACIIYDNTNPMLPGDRTVKITFETAWAPPLPIYRVLAEKFPNTNIYVSYEEPGVGFSGWEMYKGGELLKQEEYDVSLSNLQSYIEPTEEIFDWVS